MEVKKATDLESQQQQQLLRKKTLETALDGEKPYSSPSPTEQVAPKDGAVDEIQKKSDGGGAEPKGERPQSAESAPLLSSTAAAAAKAAAAGVVTDLQKKLLRAERFRVPVQMSEEEKRSSRAERFGTGSSLHGKSEELKRKARAERFGLPGSPSADEEAKKKARLERFGPDPKSSSLEEEKRKARADRFSKTTSSATSQINGKNPSTSDKMEGGT